MSEKSRALYNGATQCNARLYHGKEYLWQRNKPRTKKRSQRSTAGCPKMMVGTVRVIPSAIKTEFVKGSFCKSYK